MGQGCKPSGLGSELQVPVHGHAKRTAPFRETGYALPRRVGECLLSGWVICPAKHISGRGGDWILSVPFIKTFSKGFPSDGARNETSTRQHDTAIIVKYTLSITNVLLEYFAATFPMLTPTEMTMVVAWCRGWGFGLRCRSTWHTELGNGMFHHVD